MTASAKTTVEPFGLSAAAIKRIAEDAGLEDDNDARRVLRVFELSRTRRARAPQPVRSHSRRAYH